MAQRRPWEVEDELWELIEPLLPTVERRFRNPGRKRLDDRKALCDMLYVPYTGMPWEFLPQEMGYGSGMTCWRRLRDCTEAGVWHRLHEVLLAKPNAAGLIDWSRAAVGGTHGRASSSTVARSAGWTAAWHAWPGGWRCSSEAPPDNWRPLACTASLMYRKNVGWPRQFAD